MSFDIRMYVHQRIIDEYMGGLIGFTDALSSIYYAILLVGNVTKTLKTINGTQ